MGSECRRARLLWLGVSQRLDDEGLELLDEVCLTPAGWPAMSGFFDILEPVPRPIPRGPGVYVLLLADGTRLRYPRGESGVLYIGCSRGLRYGFRHRLTEHRRWSVRRLKDDSGQVWPARYEWIAAAGALAAYSAQPEGSDLDAKGMETLLLQEFAARFRTQPGANGQMAEVFRPPPVWDF